MAMRVGRTVLLLVALVGPGPVLAQNAAPTPAGPVVVTTRVEPKTVTIGTPFRYTMRVEATGDVELVVPVLAERLGDFSITDFGQVPQHKENGHLVVERWYTLVTYETGDKLVPGPTVQYRVAGSDLQRVDAPDALVIVQSLLDKAGGMKAVKDVHDIKGPVAVPRDYRPLWWALAALLVLAGAGAGLYWLLNRSRRKLLGPRRRRTRSPSRPWRGCGRRAFSSPSGTASTTYAFRASCARISKGASSCAPRR